MSAGRHFHGGTSTHDRDASRPATRRRRACSRDSPPPCSSGRSHADRVRAGSATGRRRDSPQARASRPPAPFARPSPASPRGRAAGPSRSVRTARSPRRSRPGPAEPRNWRTCSRGRPPEPHAFASRCPRARERAPVRAARTWRGCPRGGGRLRARARAYGAARISRRAVPATHRGRPPAPSTGRARGAPRADASPREQGSVHTPRSERATPSPPVRFRRACE